MSPGNLRPVWGYGIILFGEVSEWLMVRLSKSRVQGKLHRGFESHPLRGEVA